MKKIKRAICLIMCLLMVPITNLSVNAQQAYYQILPDYWFNGDPLDWTGFSAVKGIYPDESSYQLTQKSSGFANSNGETVTLPENSYYGDGYLYNRAAKLTLSEANINISLRHANWWNLHPQLSDYLEDCCLRVSLYFDGTQEQAEKVSLYLRNNSYDQSNQVNFADYVTPMQWSECYIPMENLLNTSFTGGKMSEFRIITNTDFSGNCDIYIHEIGFAKKLTPPELEIVAMKMDNATGKFLIEGNFTKKMNKTGVGSVKKEFFALNGITADSVNLESDNQSVQLYFNTMPQFPSTVTLSITEGMKSKENISFEPTELQFNTPEFQNEIFSGFYEEPVKDGSEVVFTPFIRFLYTGSNNAQTITALILLYNDGKLVNSNSFVTDAGSWMDTLTPEISIDIPADATGSLSLEVYYIDSMDNLKPVCEKLVCPQIN